MVASMLVVRASVMMTPVIVVIVVTMTLSDIYAARSNIDAHVGRRSGLRCCDGIGFGIGCGGCGGCGGYYGGGYWCWINGVRTWCPYDYGY
jgi:hypothetical protein